MYCKVLSNVITEGKWNNYNNQILEPNNKIETVWENVKLDLGRVNINEGAQVLIIDGKSTKKFQVTLKHYLLTHLFYSLYEFFSK